MCIAFISEKGARHKIIKVGAKKSSKGGEEGVFESNSEGEGTVFEAWF